MGIVLSEKFSQIDALIGKTPQDMQELFGVLKRKRKEVGAILNNIEQYKEGNHINWCLFIAEYREHLGLSRFLDIDTFNAFTEIIMTSGDDFNYNNFLKFSKTSTTVSKLPVGYVGPNVSKLIKHQGEYLAQGLVELIANAIDASSPDKTIGRFGEGFYQSLKFIKDGKGKLIVRTKKEKEKGFSVQIRNQSGINQIGAVGIQKDLVGTEVELDRKLSQQEQETLLEFVRKTFKTNKRVRILLNGENINSISHYITLNGGELVEPNSSVSITISDNGFIVSDNGAGMDSRDISEKLLYPNVSGKSRQNPDAMQAEEMEKSIEFETSLSYKKYSLENQNKQENQEKQNRKTSIRMQVSGVLIEEILVEASHDIEEFCLDFPSFIWLPESRNSIELTKEVIITLKTAIEKIIHMSVDMDKKMMILELLGKVISHLKSKESALIPLRSKYDIDKISRTTFKEFKEELESNGKVVIGRIDGIQEILGNRNDIVLIDTQFLSFDVSQIPGVQRLTSITGGNKKFYQFEFAESAPYDYLILNDMVLVNSKYTKRQEDLVKINTQVNLNTTYESSYDRAHYGLIQSNHGELVQQKIETMVTDYSEELRIYEGRLNQAIKEYAYSFPFTLEELQEVKKGEQDPASMVYFLDKDISDDLFIFGLFQGEFECCGVPIPIHEYACLSVEFFAKFKKFVKSFSNEVIQLYFLVEPQCLLNEGILSRLIDVLSNESTFDYIRSFIDALSQVPNDLIWMIQGYYLKGEYALNDEDIESILWYEPTFSYQLSGDQVHFMLDGGNDCIISGGKLLSINGQTTFSHIGWVELVNGKLFFTFYQKDDTASYFYYGGDIYSFEYPEEHDEFHTSEEGFSIGQYYIPFSSLEDGTFKTYIILEDETQLDTDVNLVTKQNLPISYSSIFETELDPRSKISDDANAFLEFLSKGGEFLKEEDNEVVVNPEGTILLTDIIGISRFFGEEIASMDTGKPGLAISKLKDDVSKKLRNRMPFQRNIISTIDGQDRSSMIWLREVVQNSKDALLKEGQNTPNEMQIDFYRHDKYWVSRVIDSVGMSPKEVFTYLLTPGISGKDSDESSTGMFGQGFYSLAIGADEIRVKTGKGDGFITLIKLMPIYNENKEIMDFSIEYSFVEEDFKGTIIERVDGSTGIGGSIGALIGKKNLQKYVGNLDDIKITYNGEPLFSNEQIVLLQTEQVGSLGVMKLKQNVDKQERLTKDNLWISRIKDSYLSFLPDWIQKYMRKGNYSLDLPTGVQLTKTRNAITGFEETFDILKPHIFNIICRQLIQDYLDGKVQLPMMPLDYYGLDSYEFTFDKRILGLARKVNNGELLTGEELELLKDKGLLIQYLININILSKGEIISLRKLKQERDNKRKLQEHTNVPYIIEHKAEERNKVAKVVEHGLNQEEKDFLEKIHKRFDPIMQRIFGLTIPLGFKSGFGGIAGGGGGEIIFNLDYFMSLRYYEDYRMIGLLTHEMTHLVEGFVKELGVDFNEVVSGKNLKELVGSDKVYLAWNGQSFGSHQKDLEHNHSFERIQRQILKIMTRESL